MGLGQQFRQFFRSAVTTQPEPPIPASLVISVQWEDASEAPDNVLDHSSNAEAEGQSFIIQYRDAAGRDSLRRISVWGVKKNSSGIPILAARCHERKAHRDFRVDRIQAVTDFDGVVKEPLSEFFWETFRFRWPVEGIIIPAIDIQEERWRTALRICREHGILLLAALALADGELIPEETGVILDYAAVCCSKDRLELTEGEIARLAGYVRRLRPTHEAIDRALDQALRSGPSVIRPLLQAGTKVIEADGLVHSEEIAALNQFSLELTGEGVW